MACGADAIRAAMSLREPGMVDLLREALEVYRNERPPNAFDIGRTAHNLAMAATHLGSASPEEITSLWKEALEEYKKCTFDAAWQIAKASGELGGGLLRQGRFAEGEPTVAYPRCRRSARA